MGIVVTSTNRTSGEQIKEPLINADQFMKLARTVLLTRTVRTVRQSVATGKDMALNVPGPYPSLLRSHAYYQVTFVGLQNDPKG